MLQYFHSMFLKLKSLNEDYMKLSTSWERSKSAPRSRHKFLTGDVVLVSVLEKKTVLDYSMIPLPPELERIENDLKERRITGSEASSIVFSVRKKLGPPWQWKSWKTARKIFTKVTWMFN